MAGYPYSEGEYTQEDLIEFAAELEEIAESFNGDS